MRIVLLLIAFAPIRICSFNNRWEPEPWWETGDWNEEWDGEVWIASPGGGERYCVGDTMNLSGFAEFANSGPQNTEASWTVNGREVCFGTLTQQGELFCRHDLTEDDVGSIPVDFAALSLNGDLRSTGVGVTVSDCSDPDTEADTAQPLPLTLSVTSPQPSSVWSPTDPIPFVASVEQGGAVDDARVVWEVDGVQVPELTARTNEQGTVVSIALFSEGPHEAVATTVVGDVSVSNSTRFVVGNSDTDTDSDSDSDSDTDTTAP